MSDFFAVTTDYLLKGIESVKDNKDRKLGIALSVFGPWMAWIGYITSCALWYEYQNAFAVMDGFIWMIGSVVVLYAAKLNCLIDQKAWSRYWMISFPAISLFVLSILFNALSSLILAPYPLFYANRFTLWGIWLFLLIGVNIVVEMLLYKRITR